MIQKRRRGDVAVVRRASAVSAKQAALAAMSARMMTSTYLTVTTRTAAQATATAPRIDSW